MSVYVVRCGSRNGHPKDCVLKRNQTICSKFANHLRLKGDPYDRSMSTKIFTLTVNLIFLRAPKFLTCKWLRAQFGFVNHLAQSDCVFFPYRRRSRCRERSIQITHVFLTCSMCVCVCVYVCGFSGFSEAGRNSTAASRGCKSHSNASSSSVIASKAHLHRSRGRRLTTEVWCIAMSNASEVNLQTALDWACGPLAGQGQVNCGPINTGGACFDPDTTFHHASYAFNAYFQLSNSSVAACNFSDTATLTYTDPSESIHTSPPSVSTPPPVLVFILFWLIFVGR